MRALVDDHVIAAGQPMEIAGAARRGIRYLSGGVMMAPGGARRHAPLHRLELCTGAVPGVARQVASRVSARRWRAISTSAGRSCPAYGARGRAAAVSAIFDDDLYQQLWAYEPMWREAEPAHGQGAVAVRGHDHDRALAALGRRVRLRRASAGVRRGAAARRLPRPLEARLLPAVRRDDGADAPLPRDPGPGRRRVHERDVERRHVDGDRSRRACVGRGLVRRLRLAHLRSDARTRHAVGDVHECLRLGRRDPGARHRTVSRRRLVRTDDAEAWRRDPRGGDFHRSPVAPDRAAGAGRGRCSSVSPC